MSRSQFFLVSSAIMFLLERVLPMLVSWQIFIFPVFVMLFMLTSMEGARDFLYVAATSLIFDLFSGYQFGFFTFVILVAVLLMVFFKTKFNVSPQSFFSLAIYTLFFTFVYFALLSIKSGHRLIIDQVVLIIVEAPVVFLIVYVISSRVKSCGAVYKKAYQG